MTSTQLPTPAAEGAPSGLRVLVIDENPDGRFEMRRAIERVAIELVGEVGFGTEAVSLALDEHPDVMLIAVEEPAARALDTAESLANALPETPLIVYSSLEDADSIRRSMLLGARDYLVKPVSAADIANSVRGALNNEERRQMRRAGQIADVSGRGTVVTVAGAKGGVGKSVISVNLALALRRETNRSVAVIDADTHFGDVATLLDLHPEHSVSDLVARRNELSRTNVRDFVTAHRSGVQVVAASTEEGAWEPCTIEDVHRLIDAFAEVFDYVVIDTSGAIDRFVRTCIENSTLTLVVSSGDVSSVRDTVAASERLEGWGVPADRVRYVMNVTGERGVPPKDLSYALGRDLFWVVPHDVAVVESVQVGVPVLERPNSKAADSIASLARRIAGREQQERSNGNTSLWRRLIPARGGSDDAAVASTGERVR